MENIFSANVDFSASNPFGTNSIKPENKQPAKRINGYDSTILNNLNDDDDLSIDFRIKEKESLISDLDEKIKKADTYGTQNESLGLRAKKQRLIQEVDALKKQQMYSDILGDSNFSHSNFKKKMPIIFKIQDFISRYILSKISKNIRSIVTLSDSLEQLSEINKSVDELIDINVPYGEKRQNYEKLTHYLSKANSIHSKIAKTMRG